MQSAEINQLMHAAAQDAIAYAAEQHQLTLDGSAESLAVVDALLSALHKDQQHRQHSGEMLFTLCNIIGAYVGEVFIKLVGGEWNNNQQDQSAPYIAVTFGDKEFPFASVCYHKIANDDTISLQDYVRQAKQNAMQ
ncbi:MAG: hypothetical protein NWQ48_12560 [Alishewanella sp.]|nr:hypothetical protein [Alishewanella sp.]MDP5186379.1 hypothetical protein [Alishewanella sp.]